MHAVRGSSGFTVVEVLVAVMVISVGLLALAGSSAAVARMLASGRQTTLAVAAGERRLEELRSQARAAAPACPAPGSGTATGSDGIDERWDVVGGSGTALLRVIVSRHTSHGQVTDTLATAVACA
jgi:prepilin-type N-terminal cleavage/methylation domain-containing protein